MRRPMRTAYWADIRRTISANFKRFISIMIIVALGVMMFVGLGTISGSMRYSADSFFDEHAVRDLSVVSSLGLSSSDIDALADVDGIERAQGIYMELAFTKVDGVRRMATVTALSADDDSSSGNSSECGLDAPVVVEGRLPREANEVAVTSKYLTDSGKKLGDTLTFTSQNSGSGDAEDAEDGESDTTNPADTDDSSAADPMTSTATELFADGEYTIVGQLRPATEVASDALAFASTSTATYPLYTAATSIMQKDTFATAVLQVRGGTELNTFSPEYRALVASVSDRVKAISGEREQLRTDEVKEKALKEISDHASPLLAKLETAQKKLASAQTQLTTNLAQATQRGNAPLTAQLTAQRHQVEQQLSALTSQKETAEKKTAEARSTVESMEEAAWHVTDRTATPGYSTINNQTQMVDEIGTAFPILFLLIAVLISLTTVLRMVEESRQLIGTYKALGYGTTAIMGKYVIYALAACLAGGLIGGTLGLVALPFAAWRGFLSTLFTLPHFLLSINWWRAVGGVLLFIVAIVGSAMIATHRDLRNVAAQLMRPKAPKAGKKIVLEHVGFIWNHLSFLNKVTARNLFRYKTRAAMAVIGVLGCTALMLVGFGMRSSITNVMPLQYEHIDSYDIMAVTDSDSMRGAVDDVQNMKAVTGHQEVGILNVTISASESAATAGSDARPKSSTSEDQQSMQLIVVPDDAKNIDTYLHLQNAHRDDAHATLPASGFALTKNAADLLGISEGSSAVVQDTAMQQKEAKVAFIAENYVGNYAYMSQSSYEKLFGDYAANGLLLQLSGSDDAKIHIADQLARNENFMTIVSAQKISASFNETFKFINAVVELFIVMGAALVIVVLFTLGTVNISERERELASIKVLGFRRREVRSYVNKEMFVLTLIGIILGLPAGWGLVHILIGQLTMPGIHLVTHLTWPSFVICAVLAIVFELLVTVLTNRMLDRIDMVGALKSPE